MYLSVIIYYISETKAKLVLREPSCGLLGFPRRSLLQNDKVCHESLSQCQSNLSSSPKLKNSFFGVIKVNQGQSGSQLLVFGL